MTDPEQTRPVTVVIPIYGDLSSLLRCIDSVVETVDLSCNSLLLVNDCGPDVDEIEAAVLARVAGLTGIRYERNATNLGFVGTCNRAVLQLDTTSNDILLLNSDARLTPGAFVEMTSVLHLDEKHGVVHPRSNNAAIASVPVAPTHRIGMDDELSDRVYASLREHLPRYVITPVAVGFCFLVKRQLILNYGLFDEAYAPGYSEENDFCMRVNRYGYSSVLANQAFVHHEGSKSFSSHSRNELQERNEAQMKLRYPYYQAAVIHYLQYGIDPFDWFADRLFGGRRPRVLIDMFHMSLIYNGSTRNALSFLSLLARRAPGFEIDFVIVSSAEAIEFFDLASFGLPVVANGQLEDTFDLGFALSPVTDSQQINVLNRHCVRWVVSHFDVIALRITQLLEVSYTRKQVVFDSLAAADRVIPISEAALDDLEAFFGPLAAPIRAHSTVIHEGIAQDVLPPTDSPHAAWSDEVNGVISQGGYALVVGNSFSHKQFPEALARLAGMPFPVIGFGSLGGAESPNGVTLVEGGWLSDQHVDELYRNAACVVFPSTYEGFGLPIAEAAQREKALVLFDMAVAREVVHSLDVDDLVSYFSELDEIPGLVAAAIAVSANSRDRPRDLRTLDEYNSGILTVLLEVLAAPVNLPRLHQRVMDLRRIELYRDVLEERLTGLSAIRNSPSYRIGQAIVKPLRPFRPALRRVWRVVRRNR